MILSRRRFLGSASAVPVAAFVSLGLLASSPTDSLRDPDRIGTARRAEGSFHCYFELHIEQGARSIARRSLSASWKASSRSIGTRS